MKVKDIGEKIEGIVPLRLAQGWDNVGLLVGDGEQDVTNVLLTIDVTRAVVAEAKRFGAELIVSYHPVIWDGLKRIGPGDLSEVVYELIRCGIAVFSIHTALDVAAGGVNDGLAEIVGIVDGEPVGDYVDNPAGECYKVVVFIPTESVEKVSKAVFAAGGGMMGNYSNCGFTAEGVGSFLPLEGAHPAIGRKGRVEKVCEVRFETIVPAGRLEGVVEGMKKAHPYEMPAFDCFRLYNPQGKFGLGRIGRLERPIRLEKIIERIKKQTGAAAVGIVGKEKRLVRKAAVCAGSCGKIINQVIAAGCDLYVTGELKHHQALAAAEAGVTCLCLSHTVSERFILKKFARELQEQAKSVKIMISTKDSDPFNWKRL